MLVCSECKKECCTAKENEHRAWLCRPPTTTGTDIIKFSEIITAVWREYIPGDQLYQDPQGEPYKGLTEFIMTPMLDPLQPQTPEQLIRRKEEIRERFKLRDEK